jgi:8-oxo-dGTP pyrophosphatase MutT (NUDIX family)
LFLLESIDIEQLIIKIFQNKIQTYLYHPDEKEIMKTLKAKIPVCKAGGGFVHNKRVRFLFIFRNGKWDLPKGGIEKEEIEDTAMREVEEETGVNQLRVTKNYKNVSHFKRNRKYKLKITHWFEMESSFEGVPKVS